MWFGYFLVEAYRRMVGKWMYTNDAKTISNEQLVKIMQNCIFGVDLNGEAIRIASFSLSLVMCDYLEPRSIWETLEFPRLLGYNLFVNDFLIGENLMSYGTILLLEIRHGKAN